MEYDGILNRASFLWFLVFNFINFLTFSDVNMEHSSNSSEHLDDFPGSRSETWTASRSHTAPSWAHGDTNEVLVHCEKCGNVRMDWSYQLNTLEFIEYLSELLKMQRDFPSVDHYGMRPINGDLHRRGSPVWSHRIVTSWKKRPL